ncbi:BapA/Bap/LapF family large adhesin [Enterobacter ludwigii]|uniref:BapA/Bap/LapF family large adhesin n=1 Tax=Enterobacter ludwigii TaxID=299767 RepID=UPI003977238E
MSQISVISKLTGVETTTEGTQVTLSHSSIVELHVERADVSHFARSGNDLVVTLHSGEVITLKNFYVTDAEGVSQLVLEESDGALWWIEDPTGAATYESIASTDVLLAASGGDTGGAAIWPWVLGGLAVAGGIAVAASSGGGGGGDDDDDNTNPGTPGNPSDPDTTPPNAPSNLQFSSDGKTVTGTAEPGSTITLKDADGNLVGTGKTGSDGKFTIVLGTPLTNGEQLTATATDSSGNTSQAGHVTAPDTTAPDAPDIVIVNDDVGGETGPLTNGQRTDDARPTFSGIGEAGSTITLYDNGQPIGTTKADASGNWTFTPGTNLANGSHSITTTATDAAGNISPASGAVTFVVDTVAPTAPAITLVSDDTNPVTGSVSNGGSTNDQRPQLTGTAEAGSTVTIYDGGIAIGTAVVASNGTWTFTPSINLSESTHQLTVRATDAAGNTGPASPVFTVTVDLTAPTAPTAIVLNDDTGAIKGAITSGLFTDAAKPVLAGRGEPGGTITIFDNGVPIATVKVQPNGTWSITPDKPLSEGAHSITVQVTDAAGNQSGLSQPINFIVDTTPPETPDITLNPAGTQITGTAEPNSSIVITSSDGTIIGRTTTDGNGNFVATLTPAQTNGQQISVVASDAAGNQSTPATVTATDTTPPVAPGNLQVAENGQSVSGTAEPGSTVTIKDPNGAVIGETTANSDGTFTAVISPAQTNGEVLTVVATDGSGNASLPATADAPDTTAPLAPDNVVVSDDGTKVTGTAEPGSTVTIRENGVTVGEAKANDDGSFTVTLTPPKANGETLTADATDPAGNTGPTTPAIAPDITAAQTPVIVSVDDDASATTGPVAQNGLTNDRTPTINGTGEPGTTITLSSGGTVIGTVLVPASGVWSITPSSPLADGGHVLTATAVDAAGNPSGPSNAWSITVDGTAPEVPVISQVVDDVQGSTGALTAGAITNDPTPTLNGTAEPGSTVTIRLDGVDIGTALVGSGGAWTFTPGTPIGNGEHTLTAVTTDAAGNISLPSGGFTFTVDITPPPAATITTVTDDVGDVQGPLTSGDTTDDTQPLLQGSAPAGTVITLYDGNTLLGTATLDGTGGWSFTPTTPLTNGSHSLTVHATDTAGNTTVSSPFVLVVDTVAPATPETPEITVNPDGGTTETPLNPGETTRDTTPTLSGTGNPGDTVTIYNGTDKIGDAEVDSNGNWTWTPETPLANGTYDITLTVTNKDGAGNESAPSQPVTITIDTDPPATPAAPVITDSVSQITGPVADGETTNDPRPVLSGTGTANDVVIIYDSINDQPATEVGRVTVDSNGNWSWRPDASIDEGSHEFTATVTDEAGNVSAASPGITITVDTVAPDTPVISAVGGKPDGGVTTDTTPGVGGTGPAGETVIVYNNGVELGRVEIGSNGEWSLDLPTQTDGPLNITVAAVDAAGNVSGLSPVFTVTVDTTAPEIPLINTVSDSQLTSNVLYTRDGTPTLTGTGEPGTTVIVSVDGTASTVPVTVQPDGNWSWTADSTLTEGPHTFTVSAVDPAGNTSGNSAPLSVNVDTLDPAAPAVTGIAAQGTPLTGTAEAGATITVTDNNGNVLGTGVATGGTFSIALSPAQTDGAVLTVTATDAAGNLSPEASYTVTGTLPNLPDVPIITAINDDEPPVTGDVKDKTTNDITPTLVGTAEAGSIITIYQDGIAVPLINVIADADGNWSYTPLIALGEGQHTFEVTATVGLSTSGRSPVATVTVDLTAPDTPTIGSVIDDVGPGTGQLTNGQTTNDNQPTLTGSGTVGDTISVYSNGTLLGTAEVGNTGTWVFTPPALAEGNNVLTIRETDPAGNESGLSTGFTIVVDTVSTTPAITNVTDNVGNAATTIVSGDPTNDATPTLSGTAEANSVVKIFDGGTQIAVVTADGTGAWTFTPDTALSEGPHAFTVTATDPQGNVSQVSNGWNVVVDLTAPTVPTLDTVNDNAPGGVTGNLTSGQVTNDTTPTIGGTGQPGSTIHIMNNGTQIGLATVDGSGNWTFTPSTPLGDGNYLLRAYATDATGNASANSSVFAFTVDATGPAAPLVSSVIDDVGPVTGTLTTGNSTNDARPTFNGTGEVGATVHIIVDGNEIGTAVVNAQGNWTYTPDTALSDGPHAITFNATDAAGNTGSTTAPFNLTVDTAPPAAPAITTAGDNAGSVQTPLTSGQSTDDTTPTLTGTAAANATVTIYENGQPVGTALADGTGAWSFTPSSALSNGSHTWTATATDAAGNVSPASPGFTLVVDTSAPNAPVISQAVDDAGSITGPLSSGQTTDDTVPRLVGTSEPFATVNIYEGTTLVGTGTADASGNWSILLTTTLATGAHSFTAQATDAAGNTSVSSAAFSLTIDTTPPALPVLSSIVDDVGNAATPIANGGLTNDAQPTLTGTAEAGATVKIFDNGVQIGSAVATGGAWSFTPSPALSNGSHSLTFTATDAAGNTSAPTTAYVINVDAAAPAAPVISAVVDDVGSITGPVTGNNPTNDARPALNGTAEANATVRIYDGTTLVGTVTADANGNWTLPQTTTTLTEGTHNFTATATDAAGNTSTPSATTTITVDLTAPNVPASLAVITNGTHVTGTAEAGSTVTITTSTGTVLGTATADGSGNFNATITPAQTNGESLLVYATDKAGNAGVSTSVIAPATPVPNAPLITTINDNVGTVTGNLTNGKTTDDTTPTLSGTALPGTTVTLYNNGVSMGTAVADSSGNWTFTTPALSEGSHAFTATATNSSGTSPVSSATSVIVDLTAPMAPTGTFNADGSVLTGNAEAGSTVSIRLGDGSTVTTIAGSNGTYSYTFLNKQTEGQTLQITATDAAGNTSQPGSALAPVVPLSASNNVEELDISTTATVTNSQYSDYGFLLVGAVGNVLTLLGNDTAQVDFTVGSGGNADIVVNANATGAVLSLLNTLELVVQRWDSVNGTWTTVVDTGQPQFADLLTLGATGVSLNLTGLANGDYRVLSYNTNLLATGSYTSLDVAVKETSAGTVTGDTSLNGNVILDADPTAGSDNAPAGTTVSAVTNALGVTTSVNADGTVVQGQYGTLTINRDGSYTYNLTDTSASVVGRTESFTYTITHNGVSASANLVLSLGAGTTANGIVAVDDTASLTFDTSVHEINNGTSSQGGFTVVGINLGNTLGLNLLDDLSNPIIYNVEEGTTRTMTIQASVGGVALASVFDLYVYKFNNATQTFEQMRVEPGWLRAPLLGGTSSQLTLNLPAGEYLFLLNTAAGITALTAYTLNVLEDHVYSVSSVGETTTGDVLDNDVATGAVVSEVNGVAVNSSGLTDIQGEYGTLSINASGQYTYTLKAGVGADAISTPDTFVYTITAPDGAKDTASLNITPTARAMDAVNDVSTAMDVTSVHHTTTYSDTTVGTASWTTALLSSTQGSGSGTFVVDPNTALHNVSLHFNVASLLALGGLTVNWSISDGSNVVRSGSFSGGSLLGGNIDIALSGLDLNAGTYTLSYTGSVPGLSVGNITITPSVNGTTYSLTQFDSTSGHTVDGNIFDGTDSAGAMDQLHSVDTRLSVTGYNGVTTTLDPYTGSATVNVVGHYGTLAIAADGHYTYTLNTGVSLSTITSKETFNYTLTDADGKTDSATLTINMAPQFISSEHNDVITGTAYGDTLIYQVLNATAGNATAGNVSSTAGDHWTNFSLTQGDKIDIGDLLVGWNGSSSTLGNYLHVTNSNGNTVISIDRDGSGSTYTNTTLVTLDNVQTTYDELVNQQHIVT